MGYTYIMSDIHGRKNRFDNILSQINLQSEDKLYILGDVIDRGPYGIELLKQIITMPNVYMLLGNHEFMMLNALGESYDDIKRDRLDSFSLWYRNGGGITHMLWQIEDKATREKILSYLKNLPLYADIDVNQTKYRLVHAAPPEFYHKFKREYRSEAEYCVWERGALEAMKSSPVNYIFGHTPTFHFLDSMDSHIWFDANLIDVDCGCAIKDDVEIGDEVLKGRLGCLRLDDMKLFYAEG